MASAIRAPSSAVGASVETSRLNTAGRRGFTLIEVLVVVAIIALLLAVFLPSLTRARNTARTFRCAANLRVCGQGIAMYAHANRDLYCDPNWSEMIHYYVQKAGMQQVGDDTLMSPFAGTMAVVPFYLCPGDPVYHYCSGVWNTMLRKRVTYPISYGINDSLLFREDPGKTAKLLSTGDDFIENWSMIGMITPKPIMPDGEPEIFRTGMRTTNSVKRASEIVLFFDAGDDDLTGPSDWDYDQARHNYANLQVHHQYGNNFLMADYHVQYRKINMSAYQHGVPPYPWSWVPINGWTVTRKTNRYNPFKQDYSGF